MSPDDLTNALRALGPAIEMEEQDGNRFFFPGADHRFPVATIVVSDQYDDASALDRPGVFALNLRLRPATFRALFDDNAAALDPTALDQPFPHPVYGAMFWLRVLNPSPETFARLVPLIAETLDRGQSGVSARSTTRD